jgi:heptosyltransferase-2
VVNAAGGEPGAGSPPGVLVLRFHSLGDCVLATGVVRELARAARVSVATEQRFFPVFAGLPWIAGLVAREHLATGAPRFDRVIDLQGTPGSRSLARACGAEVGTVRTRSASRRWLVAWGDRFPRPRVPHAVARYAEAAGLPTEAGGANLPEVRVTAEEEVEARRLAPGAFAVGTGTAVALVTGASRRTKEYPRERFAEVAQLLRSSGTPSWWIEPPGPDTGGGAPAGTEVLRLPLGPLKAVLARARAVAVSDSGPMHLAAALGVPVVGIFGSTVTGFGFSPLGPRTRVLQAEDVACRPCGVHGRNGCWLGHWRCLREIPPAHVACELLALGAGR